MNHLRPLRPLSQTTRSNRTNLEGAAVYLGHPKDLSPIGTDTELYTEKGRCGIMHDVTSCITVTTSCMDHMLYPWSIVLLLYCVLAVRLSVELSSDRGNATPLAPRR